jgi:hypothetical protein
MGSFVLRSLAVPVLVSMLSGCVFTQWTDHAFFGSPDDPPTHANREWAGFAVLPLAVLGDIVTAPGQAIALLVMGDFGMYHGANYEKGRSTKLIGTDDVRMAMSKDAGETMQREIDARLARGLGSDVVALTVDAEGRTTEIALTPAQKASLVERIRR